MRKGIEDLKTSHGVLKNKLFTPRAMGIAIIIPIFLAIVAAAFWLGGFNERISFVDRIIKIEQRLGKLEDKKTQKKKVVRTKTNPLLKQIVKICRNRR